MSELARALEEWSQRNSLPLEEVYQLHLLHGVIRRWGSSPLASAFVLRGGLLTQWWVGVQRRATKDLDVLALFPLDLDLTARRWLPILSLHVPDEIFFDLDTFRGEKIWQETDFPGLRFLVEAKVLGARCLLQIDVGFGDPLVPAAPWISFPLLSGAASRVQAVRPELLTGWKLDGLFDRGPKRWQAKDLYDLFLLTTCCSLDLPTLTQAIRVAFAAHCDPLEEVPNVLYSRSWWEAETAQNRWARFRTATRSPTPENLLEVAATVARHLRPALQPLVDLTEHDAWIGPAVPHADGEPPLPSSS